MDKGPVVRLGHEPLRLELLSDISGVTFAECHRHRVRTRIGDLTIHFIDLPHLIENKKASGEDKDRLDLKYLPVRRTARRM